MAGDWKKQSERERRLFWKRRIRTSRFFIERAFPSEFFGSLWGEWIDRIETGQDREVERLSRLAEEYNGLESHPEDPRWDPMENLSEDYGESVRISQSMYAALVVALWAEVEAQLKDHIDFARYALQQFGRVPPDSATAKKRRFNSKPFKRKRISDWLTEFANLDDSVLPRHAEVDAVRILNNSFKHSQARYRPVVAKPETAIDSTVLASLEALACVGPGDKIDYSKVPFEQLVSACREYCLALNDALINALEVLQPDDFLEGV